MVLAELLGDRERLALGGHGGLVAPLEDLDLADVGERRDQARAVRYERLAPDRYRAAVEIERLFVTRLAGELRGQRVQRVGQVGMARPEDLFVDRHSAPRVGL